MLNVIWCMMILGGMLWGAAFGNLQEVTQSLIDSSKEAVALGITMLGIMSFWCGIMEIGKRAGLIGWMTEKMDPVLDFLFPSLSRGDPARQPIAVNMIANMLGLGMAATPAGLEAMKLMHKDCRGDTATDAMCNFLIINISSLQLIPINLIAYRSEYGSADPAAVLGPALAATACSTAAAIVFCKIVDKLCGGRKICGKGGAV